MNFAANSSFVSLFKYLEIGVFDVLKKSSLFQTKKGKMSLNIFPFYNLMYSYFGSKAAPILEIKSCK